MTPSEFASRVRSKHPGAYDDLNDLQLTTKMLAKFPQYKDMVDLSGGTFQPGESDLGKRYGTDAFQADQNYLNDPKANVATEPEQQGVDLSQRLVGDAALGTAIPGAIGLAGKGIKALAEIPAANSVLEGAGNVASKIGEMAKGGVDWLTNNTPRAFGYSQGAGETAGARQLAKDAIEFANKPHPELADLANQAATRTIPLPSGAPQLPPPGGVFPPALPGAESGAEAATSLPPPDTSMFAEPIKNSFFSDPESMLKTAETQKKAVGKAISDVLGKYDSIGSSYNPEQFNNSVKSMLERDTAGNVMTEGPQGKINDAIKEAAAAMNRYAVNGPIKWSDAARVKTLMQGNSSYGEAGLSRAQQAYDTVTTMLKEDIDRQAGEMLSGKGNPQDLQAYQGLRQAYGKLDSLTDSLNVAAKRKFANNPIPWWIKMAAGASLAGNARSILGGH